MPPSFTPPLAIGNTSTATRSKSRSESARRRRKSASNTSLENPLPNDLSLRSENFSMTHSATVTALFGGKGSSTASISSISSLQSASFSLAKSWDCEKYTTSSWYRASSGNS